MIIHSAAANAAGNGELYAEWLVIIVFMYQKGQIFL